MKLAIAILGVLVVAGVAAMLWQHFRYVHARRDLVQDQQPLLHGSGVFHVVTFLRARDGADVIDVVRKLKGATESFAGVRWVYAGKVAMNALASAQLPEEDWSAIVVLQYPSREAYDTAAATPTYRAALEAFAAHYSHGFERSSLFHLALPQLLLGRRIHQIVTREGSHFPFQSLAPEELEPEVRARREQLLSERELGARAVAVVNLLKHGTSAQQASDRAYGLRMMGLMAEGVHGPMHMAPAVTLEGNAEFDRVAIVYYPGVEYFAEMLGSRFFQGIVGGKQPGDTQASVTVPILGLL